MFNFNLNKQHRESEKELEELQHRLIMEETEDIEQLFEERTLLLIFRFAGNHTNSIILTLFTYLQMFSDNYTQLNNFINKNPNEFVAAYANNFSDQETKEFYINIISRMKANDDSFASLLEKMCYYILTLNLRSEVDIFEDITEQVFDKLQEYDTNALLGALHDFLQKNQIFDYPIGMVLLIPNLVKLCNSVEHPQYSELITLVIDQLMHVLAELPTFKAYKIEISMHLIYKIFSYAFIYQNKTFFEELKDRGFFTELFTIAHMDLPHVISFTREISNFYMQIYQNVPFSAKNVQQAIEQANYIIYENSTNDIMHRIAQPTNDEQNFLVFIEYNGFVPIKQRTNYLSLIIALLKQFYVDLNGLQWRYTSLFVKEGNEPGRQLEQFAIANDTYQQISEFLRYFLVGSKPALKLYTEEFQGERYGKFLMENVFSSPAGMSIPDKESEDFQEKYIENTWASIDQIALKKPREPKHKRAQKLIGDIYLQSSEFDFDMLSREPAQDGSQHLRRQRDFYLPNSSGSSSITPAAAALSLNVHLSNETCGSGRGTPIISSLESDEENSEAHFKIKHFTFEPNSKLTGQKQRQESDDSEHFNGKLSIKIGRQLASTSDVTKDGQSTQAQNSSLGSDDTGSDIRSASKSASKSSQIMHSSPPNEQSASSVGAANAAGNAASELTPRERIALLRRKSGEIELNVGAQQEGGPDRGAAPQNAGTGPRLDEDILDDFIFKLKLPKTSNSNLALSSSRHNSQDGGLRITVPNDVDVEKSFMLDNQQIAQSCEISVLENCVPDVSSEGTEDDSEDDCNVVRFKGLGNV